MSGYGRKASTAGTAVAAAAVLLAATRPASGQTPQTAPAASRPTVTISSPPAASRPTVTIASPRAASSPTVTIASPRAGGAYERRARVRARFSCGSVPTAAPIVTCKGTVANGRAVNTRTVGRKTFTVIAVDASGNRLVREIHYRVWAYVNPLRAVHGLRRGRIDMGVDYAGAGPVLALGRARVTTASNSDAGPPSCWGRSCWPGGGIVVYRLLDGPFAGKYVYVAEHVTATVRAGQTVRAGEQVAVVHPGFPNMETGWASGHGAETLAIARGDQCACGDPGGWSSIEGRNFDGLLAVLGAPSGYLQPSPPSQSMPAHWPRRCSRASPGLCARATRAASPRSLPGMREGLAAR